MQLHKNKIFTTSAIYALSLIAAFSLFGLWHNMQLKSGTGEYFWFVILLVILTALTTVLYIIIFMEFRQKEEETLLVAAEVVTGTETEDKTEEKTAETFDKDKFIAGIIPEGKMQADEFAGIVLQKLAVKLNIVQGLFYLRPKNDETFESVARYAFYSETQPPVFKSGEGLPGQAVQDKRVIVIQNIPESYFPIVSGLGNSKPKNLVMVPVIANGEPVGLLELALFSQVNPSLEPALKELGGEIGKNIIKLMK